MAKNRPLYKSAVLQQARASHNRKREQSSTASQDRSMVAATAGARTWPELLQKSKSMVQQLHAAPLRVWQPG